MSLFPSTPNPIDPSGVTQSTLGFLPAFYNANRQGSTFNSNGPFGGTSWTYGPNGEMTQNQQYDPELMQFYRNSLQHQQNVRGVSNDALEGAQGAIRSGFNPTGLPELAGRMSANPTQTSIDRSGYLGIPGADDFSGERQRAEDAIYSRETSRLDPQFKRAHADQETQLRNQGFVPGTDAYTEASGNLGRQENDAYDQARSSAILGGGQEQSRMLADALRIRGQQEQEGVTSAGLFNAGNAQSFGENLQGAQFGNQARGQGFGEQMATHEMPIQDFTSLERYGSQIPNLPNLPTGMGGFSPAGMPNIADLNAMNYAGQLAAYNQRNNLFNQGAGLLGGALTGNGVGGALVSGARGLFGGAGGGGAGAPSVGFGAGGAAGGAGGGFNDGSFDQGANIGAGGIGDYDPSGGGYFDPSQYGGGGFDWSQFDPGQGEDYSWLFGG